MEADNAELTVTVAIADTEAGSESDTVTAGCRVKVVVVDGKMVHRYVLGPCEHVTPVPDHAYVRVPSPPTGIAVRVTDCPLSISREAGDIETEESGRGV
jgi:hypothetical protein